jgi:imidazolonepropionase
MVKLLRQPRRIAEENMLIHSASQLLTITGGPQRGRDLGHLGLITDGAVVIHDGEIAALGSTQEMLGAYPHEERLDARDCVLMPGFVDPHTHVIWSGDRAAEFEMRLEGKTYLEILASGGGILSTVRATRIASTEILIKETRPRLQSMLAHGTTTAEAKTGYGLETETELRMLQALIDLDEEGPIELAITFLGAHAIAPEYKGDPQAYTDLICNTMLPEVRQWWPDDRSLPFVDVFCETGAFDLAQSRQIMTKAKQLGFPLKIHADEFDNLGGAALAAELGAVSADHLVATSPQDIQTLGQSRTIAVGLPATPFGLAEEHYTPAKDILDANGILALATDLNPGTAWCESMQFAIALGCRYMGLTPAQAIAAATINAAAAIDRADQIGSIEPGKQADLILLDVPEYQHLGYRFGTNLVKRVIKRGQIVVEN